MTHDIHLSHITRIEGHGNVVLNIREGKIEELRLEIVESPRFFELMLKGRKVHEAPHITSRICGICAISHTTASIKACEAALGITPSLQTVLLRKLLINAELLQSHILHIYLLVAPDFFGVGSILPMARTNPSLVKRGLRLKMVANEICRIVVGRHVHPVGMDIGGFKRLPAERDFAEIQRLLESAIPHIEETVSMFKDIRIPEFSRETRYVSLKEDGEYALYGGGIYTKEEPLKEVSRYLELITEDVVEYSTAKHAKKGGRSIMVGALARINNNYHSLCKEARDAALTLGLVPPCTNPFMNSIAQIVECVHCIYDSLSLLKQLSKNISLIDRAPEIETMAGRGIGAVEAPRGTLYHDYEIDKEGIIRSANCIIPTAQNLANIEEDIRGIVPTILDKDKKDIAKRLEMLVRAYDPCVSCSTHFLEVKFSG